MDSRKRILWAMLCYAAPAVIIGFAGGAATSYILCNKEQAYEVLAYDADGDGTNDTFLTQQRTAGLIRLRVDRNRDGRVDLEQRYDRGRILASVADNNFDGRWDVWALYTNELLVAEQQDTDFNGVADATHLYTNGIIATTVWHPNKTGSVLRTEFFLHGVKTEEHRAPSTIVRFDPFGEELVAPRLNY
jgi:hypothetical protein